MVECDYCGEAFDDETAYLHHLEDAHEGELGPIDRRRVDSLGGDGEGLSRRGLVLGAGTVAVLGVAGLVVSQSGNSKGEPTGLEDDPLPEHGDESVVERVRTFPSEGNQHVQEGTEIDYGTSPPTSGPHYSSTVSAGFYTQRQPLGSLVHSLEHGAVIVFYDPDALTPDVRASLRAWAANHRGAWRSMIAAPAPSDDPQAPFTLTAWRHLLRLEEYDAATVKAFAAEYIGRGPENPVR